jgi:hypothetical protein
VWKKRAAIALVHSILEIACHMLRDGTEYHDLGGDSFDSRNQAQLRHNLVKCLEGLGHKVTSEPVAEIA